MHDQLPSASIRTLLVAAVWCLTGKKRLFVRAAWAGHALDCVPLPLGQLITLCCITVLPHGALLLQSTLGAALEGGKQPV
jgi:hypothetical protein